MNTEKRKPKRKASESKLNFMQFLTAAKEHAMKTKQK